MKYLVLLVTALPTLLCFGIAGYMAVRDMNNWGWFLFIGLIASSTVEFKGK